MFFQSEISKKIGTYFFLAAVMLETLFVLLDKSAYILQHETWSFRITFLMFLVKIVTTKYNKKEWLAIAGLFVIGVISWYVTDREEIIRIAALVIACKDVDIRKLMKLIFWETLIGCLIIIILSFCGIGGAIKITAHYRGGGIEETRYCLGMGHPNALHCMFMVTMTLGLAIYDKIMRWYSYLIILALNIGLFLLTDSKTSLLMCLFSLGLACVFHYNKVIRDAKWIYIVSIALLLACVCLSIFIAKVGVEYPILRLIDDKILNGRLQYGRSDGAIETWRLFSQAQNQNYFDMGYIKMFYWYGWIPGMLYIALLCSTIWQCYQRKAYGAFIIIMTFVVYTLIEAHAVSVYIGRNIVLYYIGFLLPTTLYMKEKEISILDIFGKVFKKNGTGI